ncbi:MAG TPA: hypothetical protein VJ954_02385 [Ignavibacteriaceae bacterium]|nr:hypothetical protein [Ignavibacteriaceae bacterium]
MNFAFKLNRILTAVLLAFLFTINLFPQEALIRVNRLWGEVEENGGNRGINYNASNLNLFADYNAYGCRFQGTEGFFGGFVAVATDNWNGVPAVFSPIESDQSNGKVIIPLENYARFSNPLYTVTTGGNTTTLPSNDLGGAIVDPSKCIGTSDQTVTVTNGYSCGITVQKKVLAWEENLNNNYSVIDLTFTNDTSITFTKFYIFLHYGEYPFQEADGTNPAVAAVDKYATNAPRKWYHYYGAKTSDTLRIFYNYSSDDPEDAGDRMGQPLTVQGGRLLDYDYTFTATLHASAAPYFSTASYTGQIDPNDADDMNQPSVTTVANMQNVLNIPQFSSSYNPTSNFGNQYYQLINGTTLAGEDMTGADVRPGYHRSNLDAQGKNAPGGEAGISALSNSFESMIESYGPYTFTPGQKIRIVTITGIAGISRTKAVQVGEQWYNDTKNGTNTLSDPPNLPNSTTGYLPPNFVFPENATEIDKKKDRWISTGIDTMNLTVSRAKWNFQHNYQAPPTPPPPTNLSVSGTGKGIVLEWSDMAAQANVNFVGYRVMRKLGDADTTYYKEVFRSDTTSDKNVNTFTDPNVKVGAFYYYYVQAMETVPNDPNVYPPDRGKTVYGGRVYFYNNTQVIPVALVNNTGALDKIAIVPNPYNYNDPILRSYGIKNPPNLQITFFELPHTITIRIFTESGNLVKTIEHNGDFGSENWNMTNENGQTIASGVYVVLFRTPDGATSFQKLVVAR